MVTVVEKSSGGNSAAIVAIFVIAALVIRPEWLNAPWTRSGPFLPMTSTAELGRADVGPGQGLRPRHHRDLDAEMPDAEETARTDGEEAAQRYVVIEPAGDGGLHPVGIGGWCSPPP